MFTLKRCFDKPLIYIIACYGFEILPCSAQTHEAQELAPVNVDPTHMKCGCC
jgi:hypothetical protein